MLLFRDLCSSLPQLRGMKNLEIINLNVAFSKKTRGVQRLTNAIKKNQVTANYILAVVISSQLTAMLFISIFLNF